jgi:O-antigen/teichoic acid export membrane protein
VFSAANQWFSLLLFLPTVINQVAFPILTERFHAGAAKSAWKLFYGQVLVTLGVLTPVILAIAVLSRYIMGVYGAEYGEKWLILVAVAVAAWIAAPQGPIYNLFLAHAKPWSWFVANLIWAGCLLFVVAIWRDHGAIALAWGHVAAYAARGLYASVCVYQLRTNA